VVIDVKGAAMRARSVAVHPQAGAVSIVLLGLTGLAGFVGGAAVVGLLVLDLNVTNPATGSGAISATGSARQDAAVSAFGRWGDWLGAESAVPWYFEQEARAQRAAPGANRPDRLSGPDGWTAEPRAVGP
jgi:hypothetical protein